jgi:sialic acid synthase SpsE
VGSNHNGDFAKALSLIDAAKTAGCDAVKFQTFSAATLYSKYTPDFAGYKNVYKLLEDNEMPRHWQKELKKYCDEQNIEFMSTPFDERAVDELVELGVKRLKVAGFESTDPRFINMVAKTGLPLIISLGIGTNLYFIDNILDEISNEVTFLHCNNAYPTPYEDIKLDSVKKLISISEDDFADYKFKVGLSDHTPGILIPPVAVGMGATCIEKHFTLDKKLPGPDHHFAINPVELAEMVQNIRIVEKTGGIKPLYTKSEEKFKIGTRSVIAKTDLVKGTILTEDNVTTKRPFTDGSIPAASYYEVLGKVLKADVKEDEMLLWDMI